MTTKKWAAQRLRLYGGKKRCFAGFFNRISEIEERTGKKTCIAFGAAKFAPGGKGEVSVPTTSAYKECKTRFLTIPVDEFRTTRIWNGDKKTVLDAVERRDKEQKVRGLLWCCSTNERKCKFVNRDLNAALNIRDCLMLDQTNQRPDILCRSSKVKALPKMVVGRKINC